MQIFEQSLADLARKSPRLFNLRSQLVDYKIRVIWRPGFRNSIADAISRAPKTVDPTDSDLVPDPFDMIDAISNSMSETVVEHFGLHRISSEISAAPPTGPQPPQVADNAVQIGARADANGSPATDIYYTDISTDPIFSKFIQFARRDQNYQKISSALQSGMTREAVKKLKMDPFPAFAKIWDTLSLARTGRGQPDLICSQSGRLYVPKELREDILKRCQ